MNANCIIEPTNPLVESPPHGTVQKVSCVLKYLQELPHAADCGDGDGFEIGGKATIGLFYILQCCTDALDHAAEEIAARVSRITLKAPPMFALMAPLEAMVFGLQTG